MPSPLCEVSIDGGAYQSTTDGVNATPSRSVKIRLIDASASTWSIACITTDNSSDADAITAALVIDPIQKTAEFTPYDAGTALRFRSEVNNGRDSSGRSQPSYATTFCIYTLTANGARVISLEETTEGDSKFGWIAPVNDLIRSGGGGGGGGGEANTSSNVGTGAQLAKPKVGVNLPFRTIKGGSNVTVTQNADEVEISAATGGDGEANTTSNVGTGEGTLAKPKVGVNLPIKSIKAGANIAIANNADDVTINISGTIPTGNQAPQTMAGDVTGTTAASVVSKVRGATIGTAAGALTTGQSLRVTGSSAADWGAIDLSNANATTGTLAVAKQAAPTGTGVAKVSAGAWDAAASKIVNDDIDAVAAIAITKLAAGSNGQGIVTTAGVPTWATVVTGAANVGSGSGIYASLSSGALQLRSIIATTPLVATQNTNDVTLTLNTVPISKGGTGLTTIGAANTVATSNGTAQVWATIVDANVSASAALTWSKFGGGTQEAKPTGFDFTGLSNGRAYQRSFYDTLVDLGGSSNAFAKTYSFTLPDNTTTKVTVESEFFHSSTDTYCGSVTYEAVYLRRGSTVTKLRETTLLSQADLLIGTFVTSSTTLNVRVYDYRSGGTGGGTAAAAFTRLEIASASSAALPGTITVTTS